jgi:hypothetical protein
MCLLSSKKCSLAPFPRRQKDAHGKVEKENAKVGSSRVKRWTLKKKPLELEAKPFASLSKAYTTESKLGNSDTESEYGEATSTSKGKRTTKNQAVVLIHTAKRRKIIQGPSTLPDSSTHSEPPLVQAHSSKNSETTFKAVELAIKEVQALSELLEFAVKEEMIKESISVLFKGGGLKRCPGSWILRDYVLEYRQVEVGLAI